MANPTLRQIVFGAQTGNTYTTTISASFASATLAGSTIVVCATCSNLTGSTVSTVADPANGSYSLIKQNVDSGNQAVAMFALQNAASLSTTQAITATPTASENYQGICIMEFTGVPTSGAIVNYAGQVVTTTGSTANNISSGTAAMGSSPIILVGFMMNVAQGHSPYVPTVGTGFTSEGTSWTWDTGQVNLLVEIEALSNPGTVAATAKSSGADTFIAQSIGILGSTTGATGSAALTESADAVSAAGSTSTAGSAAVTEASDSVAASGSTSTAGSASITEGADTAAATGSAGVSGTAAVTESSDTASGIGSAGGSGIATIAESSDAVSAAGIGSTGGTASVTESNDAVAGVGAAGVSGAASITENADAVSAIGAAGAFGSASITESADTVSASGATSTSGSATVAESSDGVAAIGSVGTSGSAAMVESADTAFAIGNATSDADGAASVTESPDSVAGVGGSIPVTPSGSGSNAPTMGGGGGKRDWDQLYKDEPKRDPRERITEVVESDDAIAMVHQSASTRIEVSRADAARLLEALNVAHAQPPIDDDEDDEEAIFVLLH